MNSILRISENPGWVLDHPQLFDDSDWKWSGEVSAIQRNCRILGVKFKWSSDLQAMREESKRLRTEVEAYETLHREVFKLKI